MKKNNFFITIEGVEGAGKSTALEFIKQNLSEAGIDFVITREPGGTEIGEDIRQVLLHKHVEPMYPDTELLLMFACRAQNIAHVIIPALKKGQWVISDRFVDASYAYQGGGRNIAIERIDALAHWVLGDLKPDITLLLDTPIGMGFERIRDRMVKDRIESEEIEFFQRVRDRYLTRAHEFPERFYVIRADQPLEDVQREIMNVMNPLIQEK